MQSRDGMPLGNERTCTSQSLRFLAQRWMAVGPSQPHKMPAIQITMTSTKRCFAIACMPGIGERFEVRSNGLNIDQLGHKTFLVIEASFTAKPTAPWPFDRLPTRCKDSDSHFFAQAPRPPIYARWPWGVSRMYSMQQLEANW